MFGKNPVHGPRWDKETFLVKEVFPTIQGEGPFAGHPALFLRLGTCNLRCYFCDTEFNHELKEMSAINLASYLIGHQHASELNSELLVITGGEPMLHNLPVLLKEMQSWRPALRHVQIETAGTVWAPGLEEFCRPESLPHVTVVVSPKTHTVHSMVHRYAIAWKYIIRCGETGDDGLPVKSTQASNDVMLARPHSLAPIYLQPMDEQDVVLNKCNERECVRLAMKHGYRISLQQHKILEMP